MRVLTLFLVLLTGALALLPSAAQAMATVRGPIEGQLLQAWFEQGSTASRLGLAVVVENDGGVTPELLVSASATTDTTGLLGRDVGSADATEYGDVLLASVSEPAPLGTLYWQVVQGRERSPVHSVRLANGSLVPPLSPVASRQELSPLGYRGIRVGMTLRKARSVSHLRLRTVTRFNEVCTYASQGKKGIRVMLLHGKVARIDLPYEGSIATVGGIVPGDPVSRVLEVFGPDSVVTSGHTYVAGGYYWHVRFTSGPYAGRAIRYESDQAGIISTAYAGRPSATQYVEGCL